MSLSVEQMAEESPEVAEATTAVGHDAHAESHSKRERLMGLLKSGVSYGENELLKGKLKLQHSLGLGARPNAIPPADAQIHGPERTVRLGWHPVAGLAGKWFAEKTGLGKLITEKVHHYPDPTQHWAVLVGDYCHELWMDEHLDVIYINETVVAGDWHTFEVGKTRFNDEALRQAGEMVIFNMRQKRPAYNLISNNCQNFALFLLDAIQVGKHREFGTAFAVYQRATGQGTIADLFAPNAPDEPDVVEPAAGEQATDASVAQKKKDYFQGIVDFAKKVMDDNTKKVDSHGGH
ncbi:hypothetical protein SPBR_00872 [Sporothrix brasiliensis 5110]|uniref:PPPDE domain-containing protein n=1 Tax=Sporothrix brasiliensis 5110 TaxID=1398154 RepID=A0A0C2ISQ1_9PEZI|nr:uncharacterized protein SPBR_00872 [Sporothrix brasiliensis 5110]KIH89880.1 hypothetical protein SPBR_00872 [Sporothrix brasiliensis 5110]